MKQFKLVVVLFLFSAISVFSQENYTKHTVSKGETITQIAKQYDVKPSAIYTLNPDARKVLKLKTVLLIPILNVKKEKHSTPILVDTSGTTHQVLAKETIYGLTKLYGITKEELFKVNPNLETEGLKIDQIITIPSKGEHKANLIAEKEALRIKKETIASKKELKKEEQAVALQVAELTPELEEEIIREVLPKETKYGIAREYGITVAALEKQNPEIIKGLPIGFKLKIRGGTSSKPNSVIVKNENENTTKRDSINLAKTTFSGNLVEQLIQTASENLGTRYRSGGTTNAGFDCSGLMCATFGTYDIALPRSSVDQSFYGTKINMEEAQKGDLIFFRTSRRKQINHVGMVVEVHEGEIKFIHSSTHSGVIISSTKESYYEKSVVQVNRVL